MLQFVDCMDESGWEALPRHRYYISYRPAQKITSLRKIQQFDASSWWVHANTLQKPWTLDWGSMVMRKLDQTAQAKANTGVTTVVILWHASGTLGCKFERNLLNWIRCAQTRTVEFASIWKLETWKSFSERIKQVCISVLLKKTNMSSHGWLKKNHSAKAIRKHSQDV